MEDSQVLKVEEALSSADDISISNCCPYSNFFAESSYCSIPVGTKAAPEIDYSVCLQHLNELLSSDLSRLVIFSNSIKSPKSFFPESQLVSSKDLSSDSGFLQYCISSIWQMEALSDSLLSQSKVSSLLIAEWLNEVYDVRPFFILAKKYLRSHSNGRLIVTGFKRKTEDLPAGYFRQWKQSEMSKLLKSAGFIVEDLTTAASLQYLFVCKFDSEYYQQFIQSQLGFNYDSSQLKRLVLTLELSNIHKTGGIGTSLYNQLLVSAPKSTAFLYLGQGEINSEQRKLGIFADKDLLPSKLASDLSIEDRAYQSFVQAYLYFTEIDLVQLHDYLGIGIKIIQGRQAGTVSQNVSIQTVVFGSKVYLENANHSWTGLSEIPIVYRERQALKDSDEVVFITEFLRDLYGHSGYEIAPEKIKLLRDPKPLKKIEFKSFNAIDTLIFIGRMNKMKGFDDFLKVALRIAESNPGLNIRIYAPETDISEETAGLYERLKKISDVKQVFIDNDALVRELVELAPNFLAFYPYTAENYPNALFEAIYSGGSYVGYNAGGIPEIIPPQFHQYCLSEPNPESLFELTNIIISQEPAKRQKRYQQIAEYRYEQQRLINTQFDAELTTRRNRRSISVVMPKPDITVIVPCYNTDLNMVKDLCLGLNSQILPPKEVIFIDDASGADYYDKLTQCIAESLKIPFRIFTYSKNLGLAGARNQALSKVNTRYIAAIDSDNIPKPEFILKLVEAFNLNPDAAVVATCSSYFEDREEWNTTRLSGGFSPLGTGLIFAQYRNIIADANSGYSTEILRKYGGWNESNKYPLEDLELFSKLICQGEKILVVPEELLLYRVRNQSLSRQSDTYPGEKRQAVSIPLLPRFENYRLKGMISNLASLQEKLNQSLAEQSNIHNQYSSKIRDLNWELENCKVHCENYRLMIEEYKRIYPSSQELKGILKYRVLVLLKRAKSLGRKVLNKISNSTKE